MCIIGCPVLLIREVFFEIAFVVVDTHLPRLEALAYVLPHFDALTHVKSVLNLRKAYIFKSVLKVYYRSVFNKSSKAFIFQSMLKVYILSKILLKIKP